VLANWRRPESGPVPPQTPGSQVIDGESRRE
jgi:hypothetical protein